MPKSPEQYKPTKEEIKKAEDMMTNDERAMSKTRFEEKEKEIIGKIKSGQIKSWDKEAQDFEKEKIKEMKQSAPLFFIYRDNTLFKKYVPIILKNLADMGRTVDIQIFPKGTQEKDIEKWYKENKELLSKKAIVSDGTATIPYQMEGEIKYELGARKVEGLDRIISEVLEKILFGGKKPKIDGDGDIETSKKFMTTIIKNILKNPDQHPEKVLLLSSRMGDHLAGFDLPEFYREKSEEEKKENKDYVRREEACKYVTAKVKEWLVECGLESKKIEVIQGEQKFLEKLDQPNTWIITDRHTHITNDESETDAPIRSAIVLSMPLGNFYNDAKNHNLIYSSEEEIENEWKNVLKNEFGS